MRCAAGRFHGGHDLIWRGEGVDVASAAREPAVELIGDSRRVGDGDEEGADWVDDAADLPQGGVQIVEVLEAMVADDGSEGAVSEWELRGVSSNGVGRGAGFEIEADYRCGGRTRGKAAGGASKVENEGPGRQRPQDFVHEMRSVIHLRIQCQE